MLFEAAAVAVPLAVAVVAVAEEGEAASLDAEDEAIVSGADDVTRRLRNPCAEVRILNLSSSSSLESSEVVSEEVELRARDREECERGDECDSDEYVEDDDDDESESEPRDLEEEDEEEEEVVVPEEKRLGRPLLGDTGRDCVVSLTAFTSFESFTRLNDLVTLVGVVVGTGGTCEEAEECRCSLLWSFVSLW